MQFWNMKWYNTLSGNRNNMHLTFSANPEGFCLSHSSRYDNAGFFGNPHVFVHVKTVEIFGFFII